VIEEGIGADFKPQATGLFQPLGPKDLAHGGPTRFLGGAKGSKVMRSNEGAGGHWQDISVEGRPNPPGVTFTQGGSLRFAEEVVVVGAADCVVTGVESDISHPHRPHRHIFRQVGVEGSGQFLGGVRPCEVTGDYLA